METIAFLKKISQTNLFQNLFSSWTFCDHDCYKELIFFPLPVYFVYLAALSVQSIVLLMVSKAYLLIEPSCYCTHAVLQDLDELSS